MSTHLCVCVYTYANPNKYLFIKRAGEDFFVCWTVKKKEVH